MDKKALRKISFKILYLLKLLRKTKARVITKQYTFFYKNIKLP